MPDEKCAVLDLYCGTFSNRLPIAEKNRNNKVIGLDCSKPMLREANGKLQKANIRNVKLISRDATQTGLKSESFNLYFMNVMLIYERNC